MIPNDNQSRGRTFAHSIEPWDESTIMQHIDNWLHDRAMGKHCMDLSFALHDRAIVTIGKTRFLPKL